MTDARLIQAQALPASGLETTLTGTAGSALQVDGMGSCVLRASAANIRARGVASPTLTVPVEESTDGSSWSTLHEFTLTPESPAQEVAADSSASYLRASWSVGTGAWGVPSVSVVPLSAASGGGGGSQPSADDGVTNIAAVSSFQLPAHTLSEPTPGTAQISQFIEARKVTLTSVDLAALDDDNYFELVPATPGKILAPQLIVFYYRFGTTPYSFSAGNFWAFVGNTRGSASWAANLQNILDLIGGSADTLTPINFLAGSGMVDSEGQDPSLVTGVPCQLTWLSANSPAQPVAGGDGTLDVVTYYATLDT